MFTTPFRFLFHEAFLRERTGFGESGVKFSLSPREGETILLFRTDDENKFKRGSLVERFSDHFRIMANEPRSDLLLFYALEKPSEPFKYRLAFIELKGAETEHAVDQLSRMVRAVKENLSPILGKGFFHCDNLRALVLTPKTAPTPKFKQKQRDFYKQWFFEPQICHPRKEDELREILT